MLTNKSKLLIFIFSVVTILCFYQSAVAQSGRRPPKIILKPVQPSVTKEPEPPDETDTRPEKIEYLLIVGDFRNQDSYLDTLTLNSALVDCVQKLENYPNLKLKAEVGGRMDYEQARRKAKSTKNAHILWIGFTSENLGVEKTQVQYANFSILKPGSAKKLFTSRVDSKELSENGRVTGSKKSISEKIINRLLSWGWLN